MGKCHSKNDCKVTHIELEETCERNDMSNEDFEILLRDNLVRKQNIHNNISILQNKIDNNVRMYFKSPNIVYHNNIKALNHQIVYLNNEYIKLVDDLNKIIKQRDDQKINWGKESC